MSTSPDIHIVPNFHYDVAYLKSHEGYLPECMRNIIEALRILDEAPTYRFLIEQVILLDIFWRRHPEHREALQRHAQSGRLEVAPGMYVMPDMNHTDGESMFRQANLGRQWLQRHLGVVPTVCWIADCWGHHAQLPQILRQCGYEHYVFWRCMRPEVRRNEFHWQGMDGTSIPTHWLARGYGNIRFPSDEAVVNAPDLDLAGCGPKQVRALIQELGGYGESQPLLLCNGGDFMFPQASAPGIVERLDEDKSLPTVSFSTPSEFLAAVDWARVPTVQGDFNSAFQGTFTSNIRIKQKTRELVNRLLATETFAAMIHHLPLELHHIWPIVLKQQFHDIICGTITDEALTEAVEELTHAEQRIAEQQAAFIPAVGDAALFNSLEFPQQVIADHGHQRVRVTVPAFGFASLDGAEVLEELTHPGLPCVFGNAHYCARIDGSGYITSLVELRTQTELTDPTVAPFGGLAMQMDYGDLWLNFDSPLNGGCLQSALTQNHPDPYDRGDSQALVNNTTFRPRIRSAKVLRASSEELVIEQEGVVGFWQLKVEFRTQIHFQAHSPRIEYRTQINPQGKHFRLRAAFPTTIVDGTTRHEIPFGIQERTVGEHVAQNWLDHADDAAGLTLLNRGIPGNCVDEGVLLLSLFRSAAMEYKTASELSFNVGVPHTFDYAIVPHAAHADAQIVREGRAFNRPPLLTVAPESWLAAPERGLTPDSVAISSLHRTDDGLFVRLYETTGHPATATLRLPGLFTEYAPADGNEEPTGPFVAADGQLSCDLKPFEIRAFVLKRTHPE
jgi:alpha-mannosidase